MAKDSDGDAWNRFLDRQPEASPLARFEWRSILKDSYGTKTHFLLAETQGEIAGVLPAYISRSLRGRQRLYSTRFGLVTDTQPVADELLDHVAEFARQDGLIATLVTSGWQKLASRPASYTRTTVAIELRDEDGMWRGLRDKTRNMVRRAEREGITIAEGPQFVDVLYDHYAANMLRIGIPMHSRRFFHVTLKHLADRSIVLAAMLDGKPIASMLIHLGNGIACYPYQNALYEFRKLAPIQALNWAAMRLCAAQGMTVLDMGESTLDSLVYRSKVNFGGLARPIYYFDSSVPSDAPQPCETDPAPGARAESMPRRIEQYLLQRSPRPIRSVAANVRLRSSRII